MLLKYYRLNRLNVGVSFLIVSSVLSIIFFSGITGFSVFENVDYFQNYFSLISIIFLAGGMLILISEEKLRSGIEKLLSSRTRGTAKDLISIAKKLGLSVEEGKNHTTIYSQGKLITQIPRHRGDLAVGTYLTGLKAIYNSTYNPA